MNEICKGNPNPRLNTKTKLGRVMKLTSIPLFIFTTGVYASVHSPNMRIKSDIKIIEKPSIVSTPQQNTRQITGTVIDATGMPIIGANVMVKGTTKRDNNGYRWKIHVGSSQRRYFASVLYRLYEPGDSGRQ